MDQTHDLIILSSLLYKSKGKEGGESRALHPPLTTPTSPISLTRLFKSKLNFVIKEKSIGNKYVGCQFSLEPERENTVLARRFFAHC